MDWNMRLHGNCPFCKKPKETTTHILRCHQDEALQHWNKEMEQFAVKLKKIGTSKVLRTVILTELTTWRHNQLPLNTNTLPLQIQQLIHQQRKLGWKNFLEGVLLKDWAHQQHNLKNKRYSYQRSRVWSKKLIKLNWWLLQSMWKFCNEKLHNTQVILDREGHKELKLAVTKEWKIELSRLPIRDFAYLFQVKWKKLRDSSTEYMKLWFAKVRLGRELYNDPKLLHDEFSEKGPLRKWAGMQAKKRDEEELQKALKRELRIGISAMNPEKYLQYFHQKDIHTDVYSINKKKEWLRIVRQGREDVNDPKMIIDTFSVKGPLRKWIGLSV